ncbi:MAG: helix-turn-helix transcriptional regulator [Clostridia bacterium]|nr:helix-turn-helix transcriptional regulator [Clostridia bacterium]MBQ9784311.1 helix-turn-helix transcriptional regulator [Clostridia bacterium]
MANVINGEKIKTARKAKRMSAEKLGELLDPPVTYAAVYAWEKGKNEPSLGYLLQICDALDLDLSDFVDIPKTQPMCEAAEINQYLSRMSEKQRSAVLGVARAMVDC